MFVQRQTLGLVQMHRRGNGDISNRDVVVTAEKLRLSKLVVQNAGQLVPPWCLSVDDGVIRFVLEQWFDDELDQIDVIGREPDRSLPEQPTVDTGARLEVFGVRGRATLAGISGVLEDGVGLCEGEVAVFGRGDGAAWIL